MADVYELGEDNLKYGMFLFTELFWDLIKINRNKNETLVYSFSKFNNDWFLSQRYKGIERIKMDEWHLRSKKVRMLFYQAIPEK